MELLFFRYLNRKQSIIFNKLFRKELHMDRNGDTDMPWEFQNKAVSLMIAVTWIDVCT